MRAAATALALAVVALLAAASVVGLEIGRLPRISDVWPLDLEQPGGWLLDRQLADLRNDPGLCRSTLRPAVIEATPLPDNPPHGGCGWLVAVDVASVAEARLAARPMTCELAAAIALWMRHVVQPAALSELGSRVAVVEHLGTYACRNIRGSPAFANRPSEHASANALDLAAFRLADGRRITVLGDWGKDDASGRFLSAIHAGACRYFRVAIGPAYNAAHRNHFHLDRGRWRACR
ncbi:MAG: extensin family protein [Hyphomicrobiaceae bacterium]